jgi:hypothetical protein
MRFATLTTVTAKNWIALAAIAACALSLPAGSANAAIACDGAYQQNPSGEVRTPYCEDMQLAQVARSYGRNVSFADIRRSYALKRKICRFLRNENMVSATCAPLNQDVKVCRANCS